MIYGILFELLGIAIILIGFIFAVVFYIMARSQSDALKKKKLDRRAIWSFVGPILLVFLINIIYAAITNQNATPAPLASCNLVIPVSASSSVHWNKYCNSDFGFYYPDGWNVEYASLINLLVITSPVITNYPGYEGKQVEYVIPYGIQSVAGQMKLQSYGFALVDNTGKVLSLVNSSQPVINSRPESSLGSLVISSFREF